MLLRTAQKGALACAKGRSGAPKRQPGSEGNKETSTPQHGSHPDRGNHHMLTGVSSVPD